MKGQIKVLGTNQALEKFKDFDAEGSIVSIDEDHYCLSLGEEKLFYQIYKSIIAENHMEYEGWCATEDQSVGRMGIKFIPQQSQ